MQMPELVLSDLHSFWSRQVATVEERLTCSYDFDLKSSHLSFFEPHFGSLLVTGG